MEWFTEAGSAPDAGTVRDQLSSRVGSLCVRVLLVFILVSNLFTIKYLFGNILAQDKHIK